MFLGVLFHTAAAVIIYCIVSGIQHGLVSYSGPKGMAHYDIVVAGPRFIATPSILCVCCFTIAVVSLHSSCLIINNNVNTFSIKIIGNPMLIAGPRSAAVLLSACHDCHSCHCRIASQL